MKHRQNVSVHKYVRTVCANKFRQVHAINQQRAEKINGDFKWIVSHARHPIFTNTQKTASLFRAEHVGARKREIHWNLWRKKRRKNTFSMCLLATPVLLPAFWFSSFGFLGVWMETGKKEWLKFYLNAVASGFINRENNIGESEHLAW